MSGKGKPGRKATHGNRRRVYCPSCHRQVRTKDRRCRACTGELRKVGGEQAFDEAREERIALFCLRRARQLDLFAPFGTYSSDQLALAACTAK